MCHIEQEIRNIGILAHVDAGKTSLTEQLLYLCGATRSLGNVDEGTAQTDWLSVERRRGISVKAASARLEYQNTVINLIDTPGHVDFVGEVERSLSVLDGAVLVLSSMKGVQAHTELIWQALRRLELPVLLVVNKLDRPGCRVAEVVAQIKEELSDQLLLLQSAELEGCEACVVHHHRLSEPAFREDALLAAASWDETLAQRYLDGEDISDQALAQALRKGAWAGRIFPVLFTSAKLGVGIQELLEAILAYLPPARTDTSGPLSGVVYKVEHDPVMGKAAHVRLFGGSLHARDAVTLFGKTEPEKITQIRRFSGKRGTDTGSLSSGDIGALYGLTSVKTGDVLGSQALSRSCRLTVPLLMVQVFPEQEESLVSLMEALRELCEEDPLLNLSWNKEERELYIQITGRIQLEVLEDLLWERYHLRAYFSDPSVIYKETPTHSGVGFESYTMPKPCWAVVKLAIEPLPRGSGIVYQSAIKENELFYRYQNHVETSVYETLKQGIYGWEVVDAKITLIGGQHHTVHTHPLDFFVATPMAVLKGLTDCGSTLLEPLVQVRLSAQEDCLGRVIRDILHMRGTFDAPVLHRESFTLEATLPVATSLDYPAQFRSLTSGKGLYSSRFAGYQECPLELGATTKRRGCDPLDRSRWILHMRSAL